MMYKNKRQSKNGSNLHELFMPNWNILKYHQIVNWIFNEEKIKNKRMRKSLIIMSTMEKYMQSLLSLREFNVVHRGSSVD